MGSILKSIALSNNELYEQYKEFSSGKLNAKWLVLSGEYSNSNFRENLCRESYFVSPSFQSVCSAYNFEEALQQSKLPSCSYAISECPFSLDPEEYLLVVLPVALKDVMFSLESKEWVVSEMFGAKASHNSRTRVVLLRIKRLQPDVLLSIQFQWRVGQDLKEEKVMVELKQMGEYANTAIRKAILLLRYTNLLQEYTGIGDTPQEKTAMHSKLVKLKAHIQQEMQILKENQLENELQCLTILMDKLSIIKQQVWVKSVLPRTKLSSFNLEESNDLPVF